jgi:hypothetical protein
MEQFEDYQQLAKDMEGASDKRLTTMQDMETLYAMDGGDLPQNKDWIKPTRSPDPHNQITNGARMLSVVDPQFSLPHSDPDNQVDADEVQTLANRAFLGSSMAKGKPLAYSMALSALLYGEIHMRYRLVSDLIAMAKTPERKRRLERIGMMTPVLWDVLPPKTCYAMTDDTGLVAHLWKTERRVSQIRGINKTSETQLAALKPTDPIVVNDLVDETKRCLWVEGQDTPIIFEDLADGLMPVSYIDVDGSDLFDDQTVEKIQPFLYAVNKSKLADRQSLAWTIFFSNFFQMAATTQFVAYLNDPDRKLDIDRASPGGILKLMIGEKLEQTITNIFTTDLMQAFSLTDTKIEESTMYRTASGQNPGAGASYSLGALLNQAGRQALATAERMCSHVAGSSMTNALLALKAAGSGTVKLSNQSSTKEFDLNKIPDNLIVNCTFKAKMPSDMRANAEIAAKLTEGEHPMVDVAWVREALFDLGDSTAVDKRILAERFGWAQAQAQLQLKVQSLMQPQGAPGMPPGQPGQPPQPGGQPTPEQMAQLQAAMAQSQGQGQPMPQGAQPGLPMTEPMPPEQMQGGGLPPEMMGG